MYWLFFSLFRQTAVHALRIWFFIVTFTIYQPNGCDYCFHSSNFGHNVELIVMNVCNGNANGCDRVCWWTLYTPLVVTLDAMLWFCVWSERANVVAYVSVGRRRIRNGCELWTLLETTSVHFEAYMLPIKWIDEHRFAIVTSH